MARRIGLVVAMIAVAACTPIRPLDPIDGVDAGTVPRDSGVEPGDAARRDARSDDGGGPEDGGTSVDACTPSAEVCNGIDDDCDPGTPDGASDPAIATACDGPDSDACAEGMFTGCVGGVLVCSDATDDSVERCDFAMVDEDCDGMANESDAIDARTWYQDADRDGYGADATMVVACDRPADAGMARWVDRGGDCDDTDSNVRPGRAESCNAIDDDCDGMIDEGDRCTGCAWAAFGGHTYQFCGTNAPRDTAAMACASYGYHLVKIEDAAENVFVASESRAHGLGGGGFTNGVWIGLRQATAGAPWLWQDGSAPSYEAWDVGEPNGTGPCARMVITSGGSSWADWSCGAALDFVCETP